MGNIIRNKTKKKVTGLSNIAGPNKKTNKHPPMDISPRIPLPTFITNPTINDAVPIKTSNMTEIILAVPYKVLPHVFLSIFI
jgi:hypothetical protein